MLRESFLAPYKERKNPQFGFNGLGYAVFKRTYARRVEGEDRTEEWWETCKRVVEGAQDIGAGLTMAEAERLFSYMFELKAMPKGRMLWQLGTENVARTGSSSLTNCWVTGLNDSTDFEFMFNELMLGGGVGFTIDHKWPTIRGGEVFHTDDADCSFVVPDNREGWAHALKKAIDASVVGDRFTFNTSLVRPYGAPIKTFGGTASGPDPLIDGIEKIVGVINGRRGKALRPIDLLDISNLVGHIVVSGNVRRSAMISIGRPDDIDYLNAKRWDSGNIPSWRAMSNNSVSMNGHKVADELWEGYKGNGEPYGFVNLERAATDGRLGEYRPDNDIIGTNPCGEIFLADKENCNLTEIFLPRMSSLDELKDAATLLYKVQKAISAGKYRDPRTEAIVHKNMRIGVSLSGIAQATSTQLDWMDPAYRHLREVDAEWSAKHDYPESIKLTTVAPSGTVALLAGTTPGIHPGFSEHHIRRVRMSNSDPVLDWARSAGYPTEPVRNFDGSEDKYTSIVEFPASFPKGTMLAHEIDWRDQLGLVSRVQKEWADNSISVTCYYEKDEASDIREFITNGGWKNFKSLSFLPQAEHGFDQAPLEPISEEEHDRRLAGVSAGNFDGDTSSAGLMDISCEGGACPVR